MDLATFFAESVQAARAHHDQSEIDHAVPVVPADLGVPWNGQVTDNKDNSRSSRSSRSQTPDADPDRESITQARAYACVGERARGWLAEAREQREQREQPAAADTYSSRSLSLKRELREKTGTAPSLPAPFIGITPPTFDERAAFLEYECNLSRAEAEAQAQTEIAQVAVPSPPPALQTATAPLSTVDGLALWRAGLARLCPDQPPCPGYRSGEWHETYVRALQFLDDFGPQAEALGWTARRLFGVHPEAGVVRVDACGALTLPIGGSVRAVTATEISLGHLTYREKPGQPEGVPIWLFRPPEQTPALGRNSSPKQQSFDPSDPPLF